MLRFLCICKSLTPIKNAANSQTQLCLALRNLLSSCSISNSTTSTKQQSSSTISDLLNSYRLSCRFYVRSKSSEKPDSVLKLFDSCGFSQTQVKTIVSKCPKIFFFDAQRNLKPKIDFFRSVGLSEADVVPMITTAPYILARSLKNHLVPSFDLLKTLLGGEQNIVCTIKRYPIILRYNVSENLAPNLKSLRDLGVPESHISKMMTRLVFIKVIGGTKSNWFRKVVCAVMEMDFKPYSTSFEHAITAMALHSESSWEGKLGFYERLGFSDKEILSMFRKQPISMWMSKKRIRRVVGFYVNKFCWSPSQLSARPNVLMYSLEKRIIPRCSVLQVLTSRKRILKNVKVITLLTMTEKDFVERYVTKHKDEVTEVLDAYQGKLKFDEYNFDFGELKGAMTL